MKDSNVQAQDYFDVLNARGVQLTTFSCPHCFTWLDAVANDTNEDWHTQSTCVACHGVFLKLTQANNGPVATQVTKELS
jgi:hypothetical protein